MWIEFGKYTFNHELIAVVEKSSLHPKTHSVIRLAGQSAIDGGYLVDVPSEEIVEHLQNINLMQMETYMDTADAVADYTGPDYPSEEKQEPE